VLSPRWVLDWLQALNGPVQPGSREVDLPHFGTLFPDALREPAIAGLSLLALVAVLALAYRVRADLRRSGAVLVAGGVLVAPHALPTDLVLVAVALAVWGEAAWYDWLLLSIGAIVCAAAPVPVPAIVGVLLVSWLCLRAAGLATFWRPRPAPGASTG